MIAAEQLSITPMHGKTPTVHLAPFSAAELAPCLPYQPEYTRYNPIMKGGRPHVAAQQILSIYGRERILSWGMYIDRPVTANFVGIVALSETNTATVEDPVWSNEIQELHVGIYFPEWHGKGIGTLAQLGAVTYAFEQQNTHAVCAQTSEHNIAEKSALSKVGFSQMYSQHHFTFKDGGQTEVWMLANPAKYPYMDTSKQSTLVEGWQRYRASCQTVTTEVGAKIDYQ